MPSRQTEWTCPSNAFELVGKRQFDAALQQALTFVNLSPSIQCPPVHFGRLVIAKVLDDQRVSPQALISSTAALLAPLLSIATFSPIPSASMGF